MKRAILVLLPAILLSSQFDLSTCKSCHPKIVKEFEASAHANSSLKKDALFGAMFKLAPNKKSCKNCHSPEANSPKEHTMTCLSCHRIESIKEHKAFNQNIYRQKDDKLLYSAQKGREDKVITYHIQKSFLGLSSKKVGSPYHDLDYRNKIFYNGKICMGCHSHKLNSNGLELCRISNKGAKSTKENCISCHMPKVKGSATTIRESATHAFHGASGLHYGSKYLKKFIDLKIKPTKEGFRVTLVNKTPHRLLSHPARVLELDVSLIYKDGTIKKMPPRLMKRVLGKDKKPTLPWLATTVLEDTIPKANLELSFNYRADLKGVELIKATLKAKLAPKKLAKKLKIEDKLPDSIELKEATFTIK